MCIRDRRYLLPHGCLIRLTLAAMLRFVWGKYGMAQVYSSVILFWLEYNLTTLIYAVLFMLGRESKRKFERIRGAVSYTHLRANFCSISRTQSEISPPLRILRAHSHTYQPKTME